MTENAIKKGGAFLIGRTDPAEVAIPEDMTDEHRMILQTTHDFVDREIWPNVDRIEKKDRAFIEGLLHTAGELGLNATDVPEAYGGLGLDKVSTALVTEVIGGTGSFATSHGAHTGIATLPLVFFGTEQQKQKYLPPLAAGDYFGAYALTEPGAGSDAMGGCQTKAVLSKDEHHYILNGQKIFISNGGWAETFITYAKVDGDKFTAFIVERGFPGVSTGPEESKMGLHGSSTCTLILEDAMVPVENVLHRIGKGHHVAFNILNVGRYKLSAATVGGNKVSLRNSVKYAKEREQFRTPICRFGAIKEKLANAAIRTYLNESIVHRTAGLFQGSLASIPEDDPEYGQKAAEAMHEYAVECSINKVFSSETAAFIVDEGVQILGGYGYIDEYPAERAYRDARITRIYEGTNEVNRLIIPGEIMRRAMKNILPLMPAAMSALEEVKAGAVKGIDLPDAPLGVQEKSIEKCKKAVLLVAGAAARRFMAHLTEEQEVMMRLSDMIIEVFVMETGLLRARKVIAASGGEAARYHTAMVEAYVDDVMPRMSAWAGSVLVHAVNGKELKSYLDALAGLLEYQPLDTIELKRMIADRVIECDGYPL